ncbi:MAG TPA: phosphatase PAP2 family protein [Amycolatopsis sp.]|uniref:phosphatase PAP2 family protein n=1 Tax=Amycolatopsis sp. TaxID=37632 RepID=UPI002B4A7DDC|nr:phosphatase PAP2 family protein [Amycolatopsis sp.]HKS48267.1 phosphatase PAP2 family protein [Amycolatopsis sp.]
MRRLTRFSLARPRTSSPPAVDDDTPRGSGRCSSEVRAELDAVDRAAYDAVARTATPVLDRLLVRLSRAADHSLLWLIIAAALAVVGGGAGRRAACQGVLAIGLASGVTNLVLKPMARRRRPWRPAGQAPASRRVRRPGSTSFPSGHAASAFAFASTVGEAVPVTWVPLHVAAAGVAYSRLHTGMHYPSDIAAGALAGGLCAWTVRRVADRLTSGRAQLRWRRR